jgi:4-hydroxybenzoate polyprenyltransferase
MDWEKFNRLVSLKRTLYSLPWAILGALLPFFIEGEWSTLEGGSWVTFLWILLAFCGARISGFSFNRLIDRKIDARNPRTSGRVLPSGALTFFQVAVAALASSLLFVYACRQINPLCSALAPFVLLLLFGYPYAKRFTPYCHFVVGLVLALSPIMAWIAVTGSLAIAPCLLGLALFTSISAADIVYAVEDVEFDRREGLFSLPARIGIPQALRTARLLHLISVLSLGTLGKVLGLGLVYYIGVTLIALLFLVHHLFQHRRTSAQNSRIFLASNTQMAMLLLIFTVGALVWRV